MKQPLNPHHEIYRLLVTGMVTAACHGLEN
jgi:hypothetical protein